MSSCTRLTEWIGSWFGNPTTQETSSKESEKSNALAVSLAENNPQTLDSAATLGHILPTIIQRYEFRDLIQILPKCILLSGSILSSIDKNVWEYVRGQFNQWNPVPAARFLPLINGSAQEEIQAKISHNSTAMKEDLLALREIEVFPADIQELVRQDKILNPEEIEYLKEFRKARDTLVVWEVLSERIQGYFSYGDLQSSQAWIAKAESFGEWIGGNIGNLSNLTKLCLVGKNLTTLPTEICRLTNLTWLDLSKNKLTTLPTEICRLTNLSVLILSHNNLTTLPPEIGNFTNLRALRLLANNLTTLSPEIGKLTNLKELNLVDNKLTTLPTEICNLTNLIYLLLNHNNLTELPNEIGNLSNLIYLFLVGNQLTILPDEIGNLTSLKSLSLSKNQFENVPPQIHKLTSLEDLVLEKNQISSVSSEMKEFLRTLEFLDDQSLIITPRCTIL